MALVSKNIPNFINGISQQPASLRLDSQAEVQENGFSDVVDGLKKRPPTKFLNKLVKINTSTWASNQALSSSNTTPLTTNEIKTAFIHSYKRSETEMYTIVILEDNTNTATVTPQLDLTKANHIIPRDETFATHIDYRINYTGSLPYAVGESITLSGVNVVGTTQEAFLNATHVIRSINIDGGTKYFRVRGTDGLYNAGSFSSPSLHTNFNAITYNYRKVLIYDINGNLCYETNVGSWKYDAQGNSTFITANEDSGAIAQYLGTSSDLTSTSIADFSFIVNKNKTIARNEITPSNFRPAEGLFYFKQLNYAKIYTASIYDKTGSTLIDDAVVPTLEAGDAGDTGATLRASTACARMGSQTWSTSQNLAGYGAYTSGVRAFDGDVFYNYKNAATGNAWVIQMNHTGGTGSTVDTDEEPYIQFNSFEADFQMQARDDNGGRDFYVIKDSVKVLTDLPKFAPVHFTVEIQGDSTKSEDDYYVRYQVPDVVLSTFSVEEQENKVFIGTKTHSGSYEETAKPSRPLKHAYHSFIKGTMPHTIKQNSDLSFNFTEGVWNDRKAGDDDTNPFPSFVGNTIKDIFIHRNRLAVISDENVIFSEAGSYYNFFRTTVRTLLDSAPIDVAVSTNEVSLLQAGVPSQSNLLLFSNNNQFALKATQLLTPAEVTIEQTTKYDCNLTAPPISAGTSVFFSTKAGIYSGIREYIITDDTENASAPLITSHIPNYIQGNVTKLVASTNENILIALTDYTKNEFYIYKWFDSGNERVQSSWSKWIFSTNIADIIFNNSTLYILFENGSYEILDIKDTNVDNIVTLTETITGSSTGSFESFPLSSEGSAASILRIDASGSVGGDNIYQIQINPTTNTLTLKLDSDWSNIDSWSHYTVGGLTLTKTDATETSSFIFNAARQYVWSLTSDQLNTLIAARDGSGNVVNGWIVGGVGTSSLTASSSDFDALLDHRVRLQASTLNGAFTSLTGLYTPTVFTEFVDYRGALIATGNSSEELAKVYAALTNKTHFENGVQVNDYIYAGEPYTFKYQLSEQVHKSGSQDPTRLARHQLRSIVLNYNNTGNFSVNVSSTGRDTKTTNFTGRILGQEDNVLGYNAIVKEGTLKVGVQSQAKETAITIINNSHLPCIFQNGEIESFIMLRNTRI